MREVRAGVLVRSLPGRDIRCGAVDVVIEWCAWTCEHVWRDLEERNAVPVM